jgi:hypothetical protein
MSAPDVFFFSVVVASKHVESTVGCDVEYLLYRLYPNKPVQLADPLLSDGTWGWIK